VWASNIMVGQYLEIVYLRGASGKTKKLPGKDHDGADPFPGT
jgi:hypothetical protein